MLTALTDLLAHDGFRTGAAFGVTAGVVVAIAATVGRRILPWAGLAFGVAAVLAVDRRFTVEPGFAAGLGLLAVGGWAVGRGGALVRAAAAVPGAAVFALATDLDEPSWAVPTIVAVSVLGGASTAAFDDRFGRRGLPPWLLAVTALGAYLTTPDTEHTAILLGAALPVALLGWPRVMARLGVGGSFLATAMLAWGVVLDGRGRDGAVVGGLACLGVFVVEPVVRAVRGPVGGAGAGVEPHPGGGTDTGTGPDTAAGVDVPVRHTLVVGGVHVVVVALCSRVAGLRTSLTGAVVISAVVLAAAAAVLAWEAARPAHRPGGTAADPAATRC